MLVRLHDRMMGNHSRFTEKGEIDIDAKTIIGSDIHMYRSHDSNYSYGFMVPAKSRLY